MTRNSCIVIAGMFVLLLALIIPGATAVVNPYDSTVTGPAPITIIPTIKPSYIVVGLAPVADFRTAIAPFEINAVPQKVMFIDQSENQPSSWQWDFGDGQTSSEQNPIHNYVKDGTYTVTLIVKNNFGTDTRVMKDLIKVGRGPGVDFTADKTTAGVGRVVSFTDLSTNSPNTWVWEFGDGSVGTGQKPDHAYVKTGVYTVTLTASNPTLSSSQTKKQYITVINLPRAAFVADKTSGKVPLNVQFTDKSLGAPTSWNWNFGDGGATSTEQNPTHQYTTPGTYTVSLTASNANGQDVTSKEAFISASVTPVANFKVDQRSGKAPFIVQFKDLSTNNPTKWSWEFGDSTTSSEQNPSHTYPTAGAYDVKLTVSNENGSSTVYKTSLSETVATPTVQPTVVVTQAPTIVTTTVTTVAPPTTTKASMSPMVAIVGSVMGLLVIAVANRK